MNAKRAPFLGVGWAFPVQHLPVDAGPNEARIAHAAYETSVRQGIFLVLSTSPGERLMRPDFGCGIHELLFEPNDATTRGTAESLVREALRAWEPRIDVLRVVAETDGNHGEMLSISIDYRVRTTDSRFNLVYPFYLDRPIR